MVKMAIENIKIFQKIFLTMKKRKSNGISVAQIVKLSCSNCWSGAIVCGIRIIGL